MLLASGNCLLLALRVALASELLTWHQDESAALLAATADQTASSTRPSDSAGRPTLALHLILELLTGFRRRRPPSGRRRTVPSTSSALAV